MKTEQNDGPGLRLESFLRQQSFHPPYVKRWGLYILPQYLANLTQPIGDMKKKNVFAKFVPSLTASSMLRLKFFQRFCVRFMRVFLDCWGLRTKGKSLLVRWI